MRLRSHSWEWRNLLKEEESNLFTITLEEKELQLQLQYNLSLYNLEKLFIIESIIAYCIKKSNRSF